VRYSLDPSADHSRARVRFEITEGDLIKVRNIFVEGNHLTRADVILGRSALKRGQPYRLSDVRATQEYVATLGVFESVSVELENPYYPETEKNVILRVVERLPQYVEFRPGVASGEGLRLTTEYGHRNFQGRAIGLSGRVQFAVLPDFLIYDPKVRENFEEITNTYERVTVRGTITASLPDIGLGPRVRASVDLVGVQDLQRGFLLKKLAAIPTLFYRPTQPLQISLSQSVEYNYIRVLGSAEEKADLENQIRTDPALGRILRIPNDGSIASAQRLTVAVDTRDNAFSAHRGLYIAAGVEHVDSYPYASQYADPDDLFEGHVFRLTETISSYVTLPFRWVLAGTIRAGQNVHIFSRSRSRTYPDRSFFLGGADSVRGFQQDHLVPQDVSDSLERQEDPGIRGGDLMVNPRVELRIPLRGALETVLFFDSGNVWADPFSIKRGTDLLHLRTSAGTGLRWNSPVGLPFAFDLGFNLLPRPYEARGDTVVTQVHFQLGLF
jgi:outer membrane protein assembly factor BamA